MNGYSMRRIELAHTRRWAPYAVMRREVLDLAIELLEVRSSDVVVDLGCDLRAFGDAVAETRPDARLLSTFDLTGMPYPESDEVAPPEALDMGMLALNEWCPVCPAKVFGTFVDAPPSELVEQALSLLGEGGTEHWGRLVGALLARRFCCGGRAVVAVHAGDLDIPALAEARRRLVSSGVVERVVLLPLDSMIGRRMTSALLVLSEGNATVGVTDLSRLGSRSAAGRGRDCLSVADALALMGSEDPALNRTLRCCELVSGECRIGAAALRLPRDDSSSLRIGDLAEVFAGENISRFFDTRTGCKAFGPDDAVEGCARAVGPGDFEHGYLVDSSSPRASDRFVPVSGSLEGKLLVCGDVVLPRTSSSFAATIIEDDRDPMTRLPLLATWNLIVIRPRGGVDPYYLAALINSPIGVETTLRGGPMRNTGVRDVALLPVPEWHERRGEMLRIGEWYRGALDRVRQRRVDLSLEEEAVTEGLLDVAAVEPWWPQFDQ